MKNLYKYTYLIIVGLAATLVSCDENDPFEDLGKQVTDKVPFVTTSGIQNLYPADDSILFNVYYWAIEDDLEKLALLKGEKVTLTGSLSVDDGAGPVTIDLNSLVETEIEQEGEAIQHDPLDYETARNAYNKRMLYRIPQMYQLLEIEDTSMLNEIDEVVHSEQVKAAIIETLSNNGIEVSWEGLADITTAIDLAIESTLIFQMRVYDKDGLYNESAVTEAKIGALEE